MSKYEILELPLKFDLENKAILKQASLAHRQLAELKGVARTIPNENILISTLTLQEAKDSSEVESIVTTQDDLYRYEIKAENFEKSPASKEVLKYREAIRTGFEKLRKGLPLTSNLIQEVQSVLIGNTAGFRKVPGTELRDNFGNVIYQPPQGNVIYQPPQDGNDIVRYMRNLEEFINRPEMADWDPLVKLAVIHHQFESIHPFYDGNGRTGRIVCILFLVVNGLLDLPILYLSRYITQNKTEYYHLLQAVRDSNGAVADWQAWVLFMLKGIEVTAAHTITIVNGINRLMAEYKAALRPEFGKSYRHELLNHLFFHPYTKIDHTIEALGISRPTASRYLEIIVKLGLLDRVKVKKTNYYINRKLTDLLINHAELEDN